MSNVSPDLASAVLRHASGASLPKPTFEPELPLDLVEPYKNARSNLGDLEGLTADIAEAGVRQPISVIKDGERFKIWTGHRRAAASRAAGKKTIPALVYENVTPVQVGLGQFAENLLREEMSEQDIYRHCVELEALGALRKDIATVMGVSASSVSRWFAPDVGPPEAKEHFLAGRITLGQCYKTSTSHQPLVTMGHFLDGATREQAEKKSRQTAEKQEQSDAAKVGVVKIDLPGAKIIVKGSGLTLSSVSELLATAYKAAEKGKDDGLTARSFSNVMRDRAKKPPTEKKKAKKGAETTAT